MAITNAIMQMRRGMEADFDPDNMHPGEWAVSTDTKYVRMCFSPGVCVRMATYEAFETDMAQIQSILAEAKTIQSAIQRIQSEVNSKAALTIEYAESAAESADIAYEEAERAKMYAQNASAVTGVSIASKDVAGLMRGGDNLIGADGELILTKTTTDRTLYDSHPGGLKVNSIEGESQQNQYSGNQLFNRSSAVLGAEFFGSNGLPTTDNSVSVTTIQCEPSTNYTVSSMVGGQYARFNFLTENGEFISRTLVTVSSGTVILTTPENCYKMQIAVDNSMSQMMLAKGNNALPCEPYVGGIPSPNPDYQQDIKSVEVSEIWSVGENLINQKCVGTSLATPIWLKSGTYTVSRDASEANGAWYFKATTKDNAIITSNALEIKYATLNSSGEWCYAGTSAISYTFIVLVDCYVTIASMNGSGNTYLMLVRGSEALPYEPYTETKETLSAPITLRGIGDVKDTIVKQDGVYGVERKYSEKTITNANNVNNISGDCILCSNTSFSDKKAGELNFICDKFIGIVKNDYTFEHAYFNGVVVSKNYFYMFIDKNRLSVTEETTSAYLTAVKTWLVENPILVMYEIDTPIFEPLPTVDQIALHQLETFGTVTHLFTDSTIEPVIEVEYGTSKVGGYALKGMNNGEISLLEIEQLKTLTNELATQLVAGSEE